MDALIQLIKHFGWTWVGVVAGDDDYGRGGAAIFATEVVMRTNDYFDALLNIVWAQKIKINNMYPICVGEKARGLHCPIRDDP